MSKHDLKSVKIQVKSIDNKGQGYVEAKVPIRMASSDIDLSHPLSLVTKEQLDAATGDGIANIDLWHPGEPVNVNYYRSHPIGDVEYLFRSLVDDNASEPSLDSEGFEGVQAWSDKGIVAYTLWNSSTTYSLGQWVIRDATGFGLGFRFYTSLINGNIANDPLSDPDVGGVNWKLEGTLVDPFVVGTPYKIKSVVQLTDGTIYISNIPNNIYDLTELAPPWQLLNTNDPINTWSSSITYNKNRCVRRTFSDGTTTFNYVWQSLIDGNLNIDPISDGGVNWRFVGNYKANHDELLTYSLFDVVVGLSGSTNESYVSNMGANNYPLDTAINESTWQVVGFVPAAPLTFVNPTLTLVYDGNYSFSFNLPEGKSIASIERLQDGVISRTVSVDKAVTTPANNPNTVIEGFDNNNPQVITIKII